MLEQRTLGGHEAISEEGQYGIDVIQLGIIRAPSKSSGVAIRSLGLFLPSLTTAAATHALMLVVKPLFFGGSISR